jgi:hypothetical protein
VRANLPEGKEMTDIILFFFFSNLQKRGKGKNVGRKLFSKSSGSILEEGMV